VRAPPSLLRSHIIPLPPPPHTGRLFLFVGIVAALFGCGWLYLRWRERYECYILAPRTPTGTSMCTWLEKVPFPLPCCREEQDEVEPIDWEAKGAWVVAKCKAGWTWLVAKCKAGWTWLATKCQKIPCCRYGAADHQRANVIDWDAPNVSGGGVGGGVGDGAVDGAMGGGDGLMTGSNDTLPKVPGGAGGAGNEQGGVRGRTRTGDGVAVATVATGDIIYGAEDGDESTPYAAGAHPALHGDHSPDFDPNAV
jgi:hypothetical protein